MKRGAREEQRDHGATFWKVQATGDVCTGNGMDEALGAGMIIQSVRRTPRVKSHKAVWS